MTPSHNTLTTVAARRRGRRGANAAGGALAACFALLLALAATPASAATTTAAAGSPLSIFGQRSAQPPHGSAYLSEADEAEIEEVTDEGVTEEGEEEAASLEAEGEEAETGEAEAEAEEAEAAASGAQPGTGAALSNLKLTQQTSTALRHRQPVASAVGFSFMLSAPAKVRVTLVKQTGVAGRTHWAALPNSLTLTAVRGQNRRSLKGHDRLSPGRYRLTVKPAGGRSRSIYLSARA